MTDQLSPPAAILGYTPEQLLAKILRMQDKVDFLEARVIQLQAELVQANERLAAVGMPDAAE